MLTQWEIINISIVISSKLTYCTYDAPKPNLNFYAILAHKIMQLIKLNSKVNLIIITNTNHDCFQNGNGLKKPTSLVKGNEYLLVNLGSVDLRT